MTSLLLVLLGVLLLPLFVASWWLSIIALSAQGLLMACVAHGLCHDPTSVQSWLRLLDFAIVRGICAPAALGAVLRARGVAPRNDLIPPSILWWTVAVGSTLAAFNFAESLVPAPGHQQTLVAVATAGLLVGFLMLATQPGLLTQMIGVLHIENAIALFELGAGPHDHPPGLQIAQTAILVITVALFRWYLATSRLEPGSPSNTTPEVPTP